MVAARSRILQGILGEAVISFTTRGVSQGESGTSTVVQFTLAWLILTPSPLLPVTPDSLP